MLVAIDPGNEESAFVLYDAEFGVFETHGWQGKQFGKLPNERVLELVTARGKYAASESHLVVEMIASYGMPVGREVFETCVWIGRFVQAWQAYGAPYTLLYRRDVKLHLCGQARAKDANIRAVLLDRFGPGKDKAVGTKKVPGPLYGVSADVWSALAIAVTYSDQQRKERAA